MRTILLVFIFILFVIPSPAHALDWTQEAHDSQRTGYTPEEPSLPWTYRWSFNGPDANGGSSSHFFDVPHNTSRTEVWVSHTVTGNGKLFVPALSNGIYALTLSNGQQAWRANISDTFYSTPAYDPATNKLYVAGTSGKVYKLNGDSGTVEGQYQAESGIERAVLLTSDAVYVATRNGFLHKINTSTMASAWSSSYSSGGSEFVTPASLSSSKNRLIVVSQDLYVHAVNASTGQQLWRVKPTTQNSEPPKYDFEGYWPVISEQHNVVFVRMNLGIQAIFGGPGTSGKFPDTNTATRDFLVNNPGAQNLFALNLDTGSKAFIPAVGYGGTEGYLNNDTFSMTGPLPVLKPISGKQVAYSHFRNGQGAPDGRWDSHMGEMVLDNSTVNGYQAGDLRFIAFPNSYIHITDEQNPLTMAGNTLFHAHWGASESITISNRESSVGNTKANPIQVTANPPIVRRMKSCGTFNSTTHAANCYMALFGDSRGWNNPGWWIYWNTWDPPTLSSYQGGLMPRYTYVSNGYIIVQGNGGEISVFSHAGTQTPTSSPDPSPAPDTCPTDINLSGETDIDDYVILVRDLLQPVLSNPRSNIDGVGDVDLTDYSLLVAQFLKPCP